MTRLTTAKQKASTKSDEDLELALGGAGNALDRILERLDADPTLSPDEKTDAFRAITVNAAGIVNAAMNGTSSPASLGSSAQSSSQSTSSGISQKDYDDLVREKEAAESANDGLIEDRKILLQAMQFFGLAIPMSTNDRVAKDTLKLIKEAVKEREDAAAVPPSGLVSETDVKSALDKIKEGEKDLSTSFGSNKVTGGEKLDEGIAELEQLVS